MNSESFEDDKIIQIQLPFIVKEPLDCEILKNIRKEIIENSKEIKLNFEIPIHLHQQEANQHVFQYKVLKSKINELNFFFAKKAEFF